MPKSEIAASAEARLKALYPEGGPGRQLKARLAAREVLVGGDGVAEYTRPSLMKLYQQAGYDFVLHRIRARLLRHGRAGRLRCGSSRQRAAGRRKNTATGAPRGGEAPGVRSRGYTTSPARRTRKEIETLIDYIKLYPNGSRASATGYGSSDYIKPTDRQGWIAGQDAETTLVVHIETRTGYANAEEIVSTPGVDMVYCGPGDTSLEFDHPGDWDHPDVRGPMEHVLDLCLRHGVPIRHERQGA